MQSLRALVDEHRFILNLLQALEAWAMAPGRPRLRMRRELADVVAIIRGYVDPIHHAKEEDILFKAMIANGFPSEHGPLACMLSEHAQCRSLVARMADAAYTADWDDIMLGAATQAALRYVSVLRQHIAKEDNVLYPMAERFLPPTARDAVDADCDAFANPATRTESHRLIALGNAFIAAMEDIAPAPARDIIDHHAF